MHARHARHPAKEPDLDLVASRLHLQVFGRAPRAAAADGHPAEQCRRLRRRRASRARIRAQRAGAAAGAVHGDQRVGRRGSGALRSV